MKSATAKLLPIDQPLERDVKKQEFGDWQTPVELADAALSRVADLGGSKPAVVLEPTCGKGAFLTAAARRFPRARLVGYEIAESYAEVARSHLAKSRSEIKVADFFTIEWERELAALKDPLLVIGNPPWVTNSILGSLGSRNLPTKRNFKDLSGLDALTGKSNFDVSEWMILRLLTALQDRHATMAMLCKAAVARRVIEHSAKKNWRVRPGGLWRIEALRHFRAAVDAVLFVCTTGRAASSAQAWPVYPSLDAKTAEAKISVVDGEMIADSDSQARTVHLLGHCEPEWRSGLKHDCARVMELTFQDGVWRNGLGESVSIEDEFLFPLLKSSDVANGVPAGARAVVVPQRSLGQETSDLEQRAPKTWKYLNGHRKLLMARKSSIYRGQPSFAIFGVGPYSFAPWKVAISGLYKRYAFVLVGPHDGRPVMLDDTCYFLPFDSESKARQAWEALRSPLATDFLKSRVFWDAKRPISKAILQRLDLHALLGALGIEDMPRKPRQLSLGL